VGNVKALKEGLAINKSLNAFSHCISVLSDKKAKNIPYNSSVLTMLLKNSMGGNCKTYMMCTVSPASSSYEESLNTLKFAQKAR